MDRLRYRDYSLSTVLVPADLSEEEQVFFQKKRINGKFHNQWGTSDPNPKLWAKWKVSSNPFAPEKKLPPCPWALVDDQARSADCLTRVETRTLALDRPTWRRLFERDDRIGSAMRIAIIKSLSAQLASVNTQRLDRSSNRSERENGSRIGESD